MQRGVRLNSFAMVLTGIPKSSLSKVQYIALTVETMAFSLPRVFPYKVVVSIPYSALMADSMPLRVIGANLQKKIAYWKVFNYKLILKRLRIV